MMMLCVCFTCYGLAVWDGLISVDLVGHWLGCVFWVDGLRMGLWICVLGCGLGVVGFGLAILLPCGFPVSDLVAFRPLGFRLLMCLGGFGRCSLVFWVGSWGFGWSGLCLVVVGACGLFGGVLCLLLVVYSGVDLFLLVRFLYFLCFDVCY